MGLNYSGNYEFPFKAFYWASSNDFKFKQFGDLNDQHKDEYNKIKSLITGIPTKVLKRVEPEKTDEELSEKGHGAPKEFDPLASSEEEDESAKIQPINLKEIDRIHYLVRAIENDCHIVP